MSQNRGRKPVISLAALQWAEADCARILSYVRYGRERKPKPAGVVFVYDADPSQRLRFPSEMHAWTFFNENESRSKAFTKGHIEEWVKAIDPIPPEPLIWQRLRNCRTASAVRTIFRESHFLSSAYSSEIVRRYANKIAAALRGKECPNSPRPSSDDKFLLYLARVMAGLSMGYRVSSAVRLLRKHANGKYEMGHRNNELKELQSQTDSSRLPQLKKWQSRKAQAK